MTRRRWMAFFFALGSACFLVGPFPEATTGSMLDLAAANWNTSLGAACFLACAVDTLQMDKASRCRCVASSASSRTSSTEISGA